MRGSLERALHAARRALRVGRAGRALDLRIVGAKALLAVAAIDERIGEPGDVTARLPDARVHQDRGVEPLDVVARAHHRVPPAVLEVLLQLDAERTVVPHGPGAAVDLGGLEDESAPLAERHELFDDVGLVRHPTKINSPKRGPQGRNGLLQHVGEGDLEAWQNVFTVQLSIATDDTDAAVGTKHARFVAV